MRIVVVPVFVFFFPPEGGDSFLFTCSVSSPVWALRHNSDVRLAMPRSYLRAAGGVPTRGDPQSPAGTLRVGHRRKVDEK